jgi:hypothetical protein
MRFLEDFSLMVTGSLIIGVVMTALDAPTWASFLAGIPLGLAVANRP